MYTFFDLANISKLADYKSLMLYAARKKGYADAKFVCTLSPDFINYIQMLGNILSYT